MRQAQWHIEELLPHRPPMRLIEQIIDVETRKITTAANVEDNHPFAVQGKGVPSYIGIEWIAQSAAIVQGIDCTALGITQEPGMLVACKRCQLHQAFVPFGSQLQITAQLEGHVGPLLTLSGHVKYKQTNNNTADGWTPLMQAQLSVYLQTPPITQDAADS